jgi:5-methylthioadenosine/S-adenosylhomocysteine deaminase
MVIRPHGLMVSGELRLGLEMVREGRRIMEIRPQTGIPDPYVVSVPFVNAHSHLEYRGFQGSLEGLPYWDWIRELTRRKTAQSSEDVRADCFKAAEENRRTGVGLIGEHSDRPYSGEALASVGIGGVIFQEVITLFERESREAKLEEIKTKANESAMHFSGRVALSPHALFTVDRDTLLKLGETPGPLSLHLGESTFEREFTERGEGPIADFYLANSIPVDPFGLSPAATAASLGLVREGVQLVHCCDLSSSDIDLVAGQGVSVAHCPRSNEALGCPRAPIRELLDRGAKVGLGMDSPASSGNVDMFEEMRAALNVSNLRGQPLSGENVWKMSTEMGAETLGFSDWKMEAGFEGQLIAIEIEDVETAEDLIRRGSPEKVRWIE